MVHSYFDNHTQGKVGVQYGPTPGARVAPKPAARSPPEQTAEDNKRLRAAGQAEMAMKRKFDMLVSEGAAERQAITEEDIEAAGQQPVCIRGRWHFTRV